MRDSVPVRRWGSTVLTVTVFLMIAHFLTGCATTGPRGDQSLILISTEQEVQIGFGVDQSLRQEFAVLNDPAINAYIAEVGRRIAVQSERQDVQYTFTVLDDGIVNAFAAPGGFIYITTGLLCAAGSEAEIAAVLAHEVGHVVGRHSVRRLQTAMGVGMAAQMVLGDQGTLQKIVEIATGVVLASNSRANEFEADEFGLKYSAAAGYDASQMLTFFETLLALHGSAPAGGIAGWFSTHPPTEDRINQGRQLIPLYVPSSGQGEVGRAVFQQTTGNLACQ